jgi:DNA-binding response OmpR family regulator
VHHRSLAGRSVLIVEDEPLVALDIIRAFQGAGAQVKAAPSLARAKCLVEEDDLSAAVLDFGLADGDAGALCYRLFERNIPFVLHSGYGHVGDVCRSGIIVPKPAHPATLIDALVKALRM